jgi:hypothetical protein
VSGVQRVHASAAQRALSSSISSLPFGPVVRLCEAGGEDGVGVHYRIGRDELPEGTVAVWSHAPFSKPDVRLLSMYLHTQRTTRNATTRSHPSCCGRTRARKRARRATKGSYRRLGVCTAFSFAELGKSRTVIEAVSSSHGGNCCLRFRLAGDAGKLPRSAATRMNSGSPDLETVNSYCNTQPGHIGTV